MHVKVRLIQLYNLMIANKIQYEFEQNKWMGHIRVRGIRALIAIRTK